MAMSIARARALRRTMSGHEVMLWRRLKRLRAQGFHIRRQAPFRGYYLDFVCFARRLVIEVDGSQHAEPAQAAHDRVRDAVLARAGLRTLRFWSGQIIDNLDGVVETIIRALEETPPVRPRRGGDG